MQHYLIRHAHALDSAPDAARRLSEKGRAEVGRLAAFLERSAAFAPDEIWHSSMLRARETAQLLAHTLKLKQPVREMAGLEPTADLDVIATALTTSLRSICVVGHEPHLGALASLLLTGRSARPVVHMKKCGALAVEGGGEHWQASWFLVPEILV